MVGSPASAQTDGANESISQGPIQRLGRHPALWPVAERHGADPRQVALAWLLARSSAVLPIPGTGTIAHLEHNVAAAGLRLSAAEVDALSTGAGGLSPGGIHD
jgi:aryl-alcohol dehydrogenase-like predicted oxidoreductase